MMWVYLTTPKTKTAFMTWEHPYLPPANTCETIQLVEKIMATVILDHNGMPIVDFPQHGDTIIVEYYFGTHETLWQACIKKSLNCCLKAS